ncbi:lipocalin family protein [Catalinimonas niigatensis]|uniref:lipocalin family protein n=1 Tax=Catalinimonas niigatensis TaxID=1397264 RepID=UPI0026664458|nr:lipocalin family protein [Catalinimonas niigatensis]WPP51886.1 lipocalin family protein [Catalinimonas niigatensis]
MTKRIFYTFSLMSFVLLVSCDNDDDNDDPQPAIVGTWNLTNAEFSFDDKSLRDFFEEYYSELGVELTEEQLDEIEDAFSEELEGEFDDGNTFEFQSNGTLLVKTDDDDQDSQGTWQMPDNNTLIINDGSEATEFTIESLTSSQLKISVESEEELDLEQENPEAVTIGLTFSFSKL